MGNFREYFVFLEAFVEGLAVRTVQGGGALVVRGDDNFLRVTGGRDFTTGDAFEGDLGESDDGIRTFGDEALAGDLMILVPFRFIGAGGGFERRLRDRSFSFFPSSSLLLLSQSLTV